MTKKQNEMGFPEVFYAKHIQEGVVNYPEDNEMCYLSNATLTEMAKSFEGKPVLVKHQDLDLDHLKEQADGYVAQSFYNKYDGWWWVKFIAVTDEAKEAIKLGWKVSNCYVNFTKGMGGTKNGVAYDTELFNGEYEHLAIVEHPRYEESAILSEEEYNNYIEDLKTSLNKKINSKTEVNMKFGFKLFQKKVNEVEVDDIYVDLGGGGHMLLKDALDKYEELRNADAEEEAKANRKFCNEEDEVSLHDGSKVCIKDIVERINKCNEEVVEDKENAEPVAEEKEKETPAEEAKEEEKEKENEADKEDKKDEEENKENEANEEETEEDKEKKQNSVELRNAFNKSGLNYDITENENYKAGYNYSNGFERAKELGI